MRVYVNGILQTTVDTVIAGSPPAGYYASVSSSYMLLGYLDVGNPPFNLVTVIYAASLYNLALLQADITEIFELGGAVPERFKTGSQAAVISNTFNNEQAGWGGFNGATLTNNAGYVAYNGSGDIRHPYNAKPNQLWRAALECFSTVANNITFYSETGSQITFAVPGDSTWHTYTGIFRSDGQEATGYLGAAINSSLAIRLRNYSLKQVGAICHFDGDTANPSAQWLDSLGNSLHGLRTFTGTAPTKLVIGPFPVRLASDGTTTAQQLGGGTLLPANCQLVRVRARARTGTPSITLGTTSGGADIVASVALSTTWKDLTIALTGGILSAATPVWLTASAANVVEVQIAAEVLSA